VPLAPAGFKNWSRAIAWFFEQLAKDEAEFIAMVKRSEGTSWRIAGRAQQGMAADVFDAIARAVRDNRLFDDFKDALKDTMSGLWGPKADEGARLETIWRTEAQRHYNAARYAEASKPAIAKALPYWRFDAVLDDRTSDICRSLDGTIKLKSDSFWDSHIPPLHPRCRSAIVSMTERDANAAGVATGEVDQDGEIVDGFGKAPKRMPDAAPKRDGATGAIGKEKPAPSKRDRKAVEEALVMIRKRIAEIEGK